MPENSGAAHLEALLHASSIRMMALHNADSSMTCGSGRGGGGEGVITH